MYKLFLSILLFLLIDSSLFAQAKCFDLDLGLNQSWLIFENNNSNTPSTNFGPKLSMSLNYNFTEIGNFFTSIGIRYFNLGKSYNVDIINSKKEPVTLNHYLLSLPIQLKYKISNINTYAFLNIEGAYILTANFISPDLLKEETMTNEMNRTQLLIGIGMEYNFNISEELFGIKVFYNYDITPIPKEGYSWIGYKANEINLFISYYFLRLNY